MKHAFGFRIIIIFFVSSQIRIFHMIGCLAQGVLSEVPRLHKQRHVYKSNNKTTPSCEFTKDR